MRAYVPLEQYLMHTPEWIMITIIQASIEAKDASFHFSDKSFSWEVTVTPEGYSVPGQEPTTVKALAIWMFQQMEASI